MKSGCLSGTGLPADQSKAQEAGDCANTGVELTVGSTTLEVVHRGAIYNCCAEEGEVTISMTVDGNLLRLTETAHVASPCFCDCCTDVETTVSGLQPGTYTVELCWQDADTDYEQCDTQQVNIPS